MRNIIIGIIILAVLVYGGYRVKHHYDMQALYQHQVAQPTAKPSPTHAMMTNTVYKSMSDAKLGSIMTDAKGMTLYTYAKDTTGVSNCSGQCLAIWPAYIAPASASNLPTDVTVIKRTDGTMQYAYKGIPLYYYSKDKKSGDVNGNGVLQQWSVVKL